MTAFPKIPKSAIAVLNTAGMHSLEDMTAWPEDQVAELRGVGPKAFATLQQAMNVAGLEFDPTSDKQADGVNRAMAAERMKDVKTVPDEQVDLPRIGRPATSALVQIDVLRLEQLTTFTRQQILDLHGMGPKAVGILEEALAAKGLSFAEA